MDAILTLTYDSTHYYLVDCAGGKLLVDAGMAGTLPKFRAQMKALGLELSAIRWVMMTHSHPDHAGILQEVKRAAGAKLLIHEKQLPYLAELAAFYAKKGGYTPIRVEAGDKVVSSPNRAALQAIGVRGELVETPGHSPDSVTLLLDGGQALVGDLNPYYGEGPDGTTISDASWQTLIRLGARTFYPAHAQPFNLATLQGLLSQRSE